MELKVMTFNLRYDGDGDGINRWQYRTELVKKAITEESPDIIGFQEITRRMYEDVRSMLSEDYVVLGAGRERDFSGEGANIAFKKSLFDLLYLDTFWLSDTPGLPGSRYKSLDQSGCPRVALIARLAVRGVGETFLFCNTHLDHEGEKARLAGARLIVEKLGRVFREKDCVVITGDMNALPNTAEVSALCDTRLGLKDITSGLGSTFHKWGTLADDGSEKIDYIITNNPCDGKPSYVVKKYEKNGVYCSDHYPVCGFVKI